MQRLKRLTRERELIEFRIMPGQEDDWAAGSELEVQSPLWRALGVYPLLIFISIYFAMIGLS